MTRPSALHASRQPLIGPSSRVPSGGRPRLFSLEERNADGLPPGGAAASSHHVRGPGSSAAPALSRPSAFTRATSP